MASSRHSPITEADYEALAAFRHAVGRFLNFSGSAARKVGLSPQQHQALLAIKGGADRGAITVKELAGRLHLRHNSAVGLVDRLVRKKFARRLRDPDDRRVVRIALASAGEAKIARLSKTHREELLRTGPELQDRLAKVLELAGRSR